MSSTGATGWPDHVAAFARLLISAMREAVVVTDAEGRVTYWNDGAARVFGWSASERIGRPLVERLPKHARAGVADQMRAVLEGAEWHGECEDYRKDGSHVWLNASVRRLQTDDGTVIGILGIAEDITDRKRSEIERNAAQAERDYLWNNSPDPVCTAGFDGYFHQLNPAWTRRLGWSEEELKARPWLDFVHPDDREATIAAGERLRRGHVVYGFVNRYRTREGTYRWFSWNAIPFPDRQSISAFVRDVTEEERLSEQVRQSQKLEAIGRLAGGIAHDFNNLLTIINGYTALLMDEAPRDGSQREALESIRDAGERAATVTAQLLTFSRKAIVEPKALDLNRAAGSALRLLRRLIGEDIDLVTDLAPDLPIIRIDPGQLEQVVMNLVVNGRDAMPGGGVLRVSTSEVAIDDLSHDTAPDVPPGRYVRLTVADSGGGMNADVKALVFEPFFTTKPVGKGTGLGLATVYGIVRQAGGSISVESTVGEGSAFHVLFPALDGEHASNADDVPVATHARPGHETVLIVEDEQAVSRFAKRTLERHGYFVLEASSAREATSFPPATLARVDLLVADVMLPVTGGRELADALRRQYPRLRVLYTSGYTDDAGVRHGLVSSTDAFLQKPFTSQALARKVRELLD